MEITVITRRSFIAAALAVPALPLASARAQTAKDQAKQADFLFVQTAKSMTFDKSTNKLTLNGISSTTLFFSDRPERIAGNIKPQRSYRSGARGRTVFSPTRPTLTFPSLKAISSARSSRCCKRRF